MSLVHSASGVWRNCLSPGVVPEPDTPLRRVLGHKKLLMSGTRLAHPGDLVGEDLKYSEQCGRAVEDVVVGFSRGCRSASAVSV